MAKAKTLYANAQPEKRLFISLITRDISLGAAVLDLIDNSINSAAEAAKLDLSSPAAFVKLLDRPPTPSLPKIVIAFDATSFEIHDNCGGITTQQAQQRVFAFGRPASAGKPTHDTLSVYGIGLKRALFKLGNNVEIMSAHKRGGFNLKLDVEKWGKLRQARWRFPITARKTPLPGGVGYGTTIKVTNLYPDISDRLADSNFEGDLITRISRTYNYFINRLITVEVNGKEVPGSPLQLGSNFEENTFDVGEVGCSVLAGIEKNETDKFHRDERAGWYIFCNGRAVASAEKSVLTGWGDLLPIYQPKHRPFVGIVFFAAADLEQLPWTTTKSSINEESKVWQHALRIMASTAKPVLNTLDKRYKKDGTEITTEELREVAGSSISALSAIAGGRSKFLAPKPKRTTTSIQFTVKISEVSEVKEYLGDRYISNSEIGRTTFVHYLDNVVRA